MKDLDLIVVGTGLAGLTAALAAAERGARVLVCGQGMGSMALFGNTVDVLGTLPSGTDLAAGVERWIREHPDHPYRRPGWPGIAAALAFFCRHFPPPYNFSAAGEGNSLIPTAAGTMRPTYLVPATMKAAVGIVPEDTLIVGFQGFKDFQALTAASHLGCRGINIRLPRYGLEGLGALALAHLLEEESFCAGLAQEIRQQKAGERRIGLPAVLGVRNPAGVLEVLEAVAGARIFEIPMLPPSIPGLRVFNRFRDALVERGATVLMGNVVSALTRAGRCEGIVVHNPPLAMTYRAEQYVVATGRFLGGGLRAGMDRITEPLLQLPVRQPAGRGAWFRERFFNASHPIHYAGIETDQRLRPLDDQGRVALENVRVAGSILAHHQAMEEHSREGIDIATGYLAAQEALGP